MLKTEEINRFLDFMEKYPHNLQEGFDTYAQLYGKTPAAYEARWYTNSKVIAMRKERARLLTASPKVALFAGKQTRRITDQETGEFINDTNTTGNIPFNENVSQTIRRLTNSWFTTITR